MKKPKPKRRLTRLERTAYHEAGHVVAHCLLRLPFAYVTIVPDEECLGHVHGTESSKRNREALEFGPPSLRVCDYWQRQIIAMYAGEAVTKHITGRHDWRGGRRDHHDVMDISMRLCGNEKEWNAYMAWLGLQATGIITAPSQWKAVEAVAKALLVEKKISAQRCRRLVKEACTIKVAG